MSGAACVDIHVFQSGLLTAEVEDEEGFGQSIVHNGGIGCARDVGGTVVARRDGVYPRPNPLVGNISIACDVGGTLRGEGGDEPRPYGVTLRAVVVTLRPNILEEILLIYKQHILFRHCKRAARQVLASLIKSLQAYLL